MTDEQKQMMIDKVIHDCEICYNGSCPKMRHFFDVEYREEIKKYRKD